MLTNFTTIIILGITSCSCLLFVSCWCLMIALHSTKVGDRGALSVGMWTLTVFSLMVTTKRDFPEGMACFVGEDGVALNSKAYGELRFGRFSWGFCNFVFVLADVLDLEFVLLADKGGVGVALVATPFFPVPVLKDKQTCLVSNADGFYHFFFKWTSPN